MKKNKLAESEKKKPGILKLCLFSLITTVLFFGLIEGALRILPSAYFTMTRSVSDDESDWQKTVLTIGDSFTFGLHLEPSESYPGQLQELLIKNGYQNVRVANAGYPSITPNMIKKQLPKQIKKFEPDLIVLLSGYNIHDGDILEYKDTFGADPADSSLLFRLRVFFLNFKIFRVMDHLVNRYLFPHQGQNEKYKAAMDLFNFMSYQKVNYWSINNLIEAIRQEGIPLILMNYPEVPLPENPCSDREYYYWVFTRYNNCSRITEEDYLFPTGTMKEIAINAIIRHISQTANIPLVDNVQSFRQLKNLENYFIPSDEHPNREGYQIVAENTFTKLRELGFLPQHKPE